MNLINLGRKGLALVTTLSVVCGTVTPVAATGEDETRTPISFTETNAVSGGKANVSKDVALNYSDDAVVRATIVLEGEPALSKYSVQGIGTNASAKGYRAQLAEAQASLASRISSEALNGEALDVVWNLTLVSNSMSVKVKYGQLDAIRNVPGVKNVYVEAQYSVPETKQVSDPNSATSGNMIGAGAAYANGYTGAGSRIAIVDTGLDLDHRSFDSSAYMYSLAELAGKKGVSADDYIASLDLLGEDDIAAVLDQLHITQPEGEDATAITASDLYRNAKIPFGYNYIDLNAEHVDHDNDDEGEHGSHVGGIAAANKYVPNENGTYSHAIETVLAQGVAPDAQLFAMKVFGANGGAYDSDYMVAIEDAVTLGADAVNLSLGSPCGLAVEWDYEFQETLDRLEETGIVATISAGNNGTYTQYDSNIHYLYAEDIDYSTAGTPGAYANSISVASADNTGKTGGYLMSGDSVIFYNETSYSNAPFETLAGDQTYIAIDGFGTDDDFAEVASVLEGKIAVCSRGTTSFYQKAEAAVNNGAIGTIIYNNQAGTINMDLSSYRKSQPCISITKADGEILKANAEKKSLEYTNADGESKTVEYYEGTINVSEKAKSFPAEEGTPVKMSDFSSWGVPSDLSMKPEITAPGGNIYSVNGAVAGGQAYELMSGTSMAAPQVAGMVGVVAQYIRENGLAEKTGLSNRQLAQSLLMATAEPIVDEDSGEWYPVLQQGAGLGNVGNAVSAKSYILMDESATASAADGKVKVELGQDAEKTGVYTAKFSVNNMTDEAIEYTLATDMFTQDIFEYEGARYLDTWTIPLNAEVTYKINGEEFVPVAKSDADVDKDGDTDLDDAKAVLAYIDGNNDGTELDLDAADVNGDGEVTSYDAHLILTFVDEAGFTVEGSGSADVEVTMTLTDEQKASLDSDYVNGAWIQAYIFVKPASTAEGEIADIEYSIPVLGFYGNITDSTAYDKGSFLDFCENNTYDEKTGAYTYDTDRMPYSYQTFQARLSGVYRTNALVALNEDGSGNFVIGNPYKLGAVRPDDLYVNGDKYLEYMTRNIHNAGVYSSYLKDANGEYVWVDPASALGQRKTFYHTSYGYWLEFTDEGGYYYGGIARKTEETLSQLGFNEDDSVSFGTVVIPEIYTKGMSSKDVTADWVLEMIKSGKLGDGAYLESTAVIDNTYPTLDLVMIERYESSGVKTQLELTGTDNNWVAGMGLVDYSGWFMMDDFLQYLYQLFDYGPSDFAVDIGTWTPEALGEKGEPAVALIDVTDALENVSSGDSNPQYWYVYAGDYASNEIGGLLAGEDDEEPTEEQRAAANARALAKHPLPEEVVNGTMTAEEYLAKNPGFKLGGLNAVNVDEEADVVVDKDAGKVSFDVTAEDSTNGLVTITYDAAVLKLESVKGLEAYSDYNDGEEGKVVLGYAASEAVNDKAAKLVFSYDDHSGIDSTTVTVTTEQDGEEKPGISQDVVIALEQADVTINAAAGPNGTITPAGAQTVKAGTEVSYEISPSVGYMVEEILVNGEAAEAVDGKLSFTATEDTNVYVSFTEDPDYVAPAEQKNVTLIVEGNGTAEIDKEGLVDYGTEVTVTWNAESGNVVDYIKVNGVAIENPEASFTVTVESDTVINVVFRILHIEFYEGYWYENGIIQGTVDDPKGVKDTQFNQTVRGREIYDPATDKWYWLDAVFGGLPAKDKEVWMPYIYQDEEPGSTDGKWVRYDAEGGMVKGWYANDNGAYYYDLVTGAMAKGTVVIDDVTYTFDPVTGILIG